MTSAWVQKPTNATRRGAMSTAHCGIAVWGVRVDKSCVMETSGDRDGGATSGAEFQSWSGVPSAVAEHRMVARHD